MKFRTLAMSTLWIGLFVTTVMALRAADEKAKAKEDEVLPSPGTVKFATAPAAVQKTFKDEVKNVKIELLGKAEDGSFYKAIVPIGENDYTVAVGKDGLLLEKVLEPVRVEEIKLTDCPAPVQKALQADAKGAKIDAIVKESEGKRADFIIDVTLQKLKYQLIIADDGTLLSKIIDSESVPSTTPNDKQEAPKEKPADKTVKKPK